MRYSRKTFNYSERIALSDLTHMMSVDDHVAIGMETDNMLIRHDNTWLLMHIKA